MKRRAVTAFVAFAAFGAYASATVAAEPKLVNLTQVPCQFVESEGGVDHGFKSVRSEDCVAINRTSADKRGALPVLELKAGKHVFRVTNRNVPYELGFWIRGASLKERAILPSISGGGLTEGKSRDYAVDLKPGNYLYSCPLNPTPDYRIVVR